MIRKSWTNAVTRAVYKAIAADWLKAQGRTVEANVAQRFARSLVARYRDQAAARLATQLEADVRTWLSRVEREPLTDAIQAGGLRQVDWRQIADRLLIRFAATRMPREEHGEELAGPLCLYPFTRPPEEPRP